MFGNRSLKQILRAIIGIQHYIAFFNMFQVYINVPDAIKRYLFGAGTYPVSVRIKTPVGIHDVYLYSYHDFLTVNEIFCRNDYPANHNLRVAVDIGSNIGISALFFLTRNSHSYCYLFEPDPKNIVRLHHQLKDFEGRYELQDCAIAHYSGRVIFGVEDTGRYGGIGVKTEKSITVDCQHINVVLGKIIAKEGVIDVLKIDSEGLEIPTVKAIDDKLLTNISTLKQNPRDTFYQCSISGNMVLYVI